MAVSSTTYKNTYTGDGSTTTFNYGFRILQAADLKVTKYTIADGSTETLTLTSDYNVSGVDSAGGGSITLTGSAPSSDYKIILTRDAAYTQATDWVENDPNRAEVLEDAIDKNCMLILQLKEETDRMVLQDLAASSQITFPTPATAGYLHTDGSGNYEWTTGGAVSITAISQIASSLRTGSDTNIVTGTAGTENVIPAWDANGDIIDGSSPKLGGDLDLNDNDIKSTSGDIILQDDNSGGIHSSPNQSGCSVYLGSNQSITVDTDTKVELDTENYDTQNEFDSSTNYRFTVTKAGVYSVKALIYFSVTADQDGLKGSIQVNGSSVSSAYVKAAKNGATSVPITKNIKLSANDYVEIFAFNDNNDDTLAGAANATYLTISKIQ